MGVVAQTLLGVGVVTAISLIGVITLAVRRDSLKTLLPFLVALSAGALIGSAVLDLIPGALSEISRQSVLVSAVAGGLIFFILEKILHWHHHHVMHNGKNGSRECEPEIHSYGKLILAADGLHNIIDGVVVAAAFSIGTGAGIAATAAVVLHEIPQEIGDFGVLVHAGFGRGRALIANLASASLAFAGAIGALIFVGVSQAVVPYLAAAAGGGFLYIAFTDLIPALRREATGVRRTAVYAAVMLIGFALMLALLFVETGVHG